MADSSGGGIAGSLKEGYAEGPKLRQAKKGVLMKAVPSALMVFIILLPLLFWWRSGDDAPTKTATTPPVATAPATPQKQRDNVATWSGAPSGSTLQLNVWSDAVKVGPGCSATFADGNGIWYATQYRYYEKGWHDHIPGTNPKASEIRFMVLRIAGDTLPFKITCQ